MGQKANLATLRPSTKSLNLISSNSKNYTFLYHFLNLLKLLFYKKNVVVADRTLNIVNNQLYLNLHFFYKSIKTSIYKKKKSKFLKNLKKKQILKNVNLSKLFFPLYSKMRCNMVIFSFLNTNKKVKRPIVLALYKKLKKFMNTIFPRRFNLFIDFLKMTSLLVTDCLSVETYLKMLSLIFRVLQKKYHNRFLFFLKSLFKILIHNVSSLTFCKKQNFGILGIKFIINGKLKGKPRSSSFIFQRGSTKTQTINSNIEFAKTNSYTRLGAFGFRIWLLRKKINR